MNKFRRLISLLIIVCLIVFAYFNQPWCKKQINKARGMYYVYQGDKQYRKHKTAIAIDKYKRALELYPEHYRAWYNLGNIYVVYEDYFSAVDAYEHAIKYKSNFTLARMNLGIVLAEELGDFDGAIKQYDAILQSKRSIFFIPFIFNNLRSTRINKGRAYYNRGLAYKQKAIYIADNLRNLSPNFLSKAIESYKNALKYLKKDYDATYNLALAYHLSDDFKNAGKNYCNAIDISPMSYEAHYNLAILLRQMKLYRASISELEKAALLLSEGHGDLSRTSYVFDILNEVSKLLSVYNFDNRYTVGVYNHVGNGPVDYSEMDGYADTSYTSTVMVNGKIIATDDLDKAIMKSFSSCPSLPAFEENEYDKQ